MWTGWERCRPTSRQTLDLILAVLEARDQCDPRSDAEANHFDVIERRLEDRVKQIRDASDKLKEAVFWEQPRDLAKTTWSLTEDDLLQMMSLHQSLTWAEAHARKKAIAFSKFRTNEPQTRKRNRVEAKFAAHMGLAIHDMVGRYLDELVADLTGVAYHCEYDVAAAKMARVREKRRRQQAILRLDSESAVIPEVPLLDWTRRL